eukprot:SAG22_NODE_542_length_9294_cov_156.554649_9_plen_72_part_00
MNTKPTPKRERSEYFRRYYTINREYQNAKAKLRYQNDPEFKKSCAVRDKRRRQFRAWWCGLLDIDPKLFEC